MNKVFLYRLFKGSKILFLFAVVFISCYGIVLRKQMDMLLFPINSMFSDVKTQDFSTTTYALKLNGDVVKITDDSYLKKDFSENSLQIFSKWIKANSKDLMTDLLEREIKDSARRIFFLKNLTPPKNTIQTWPAWFVKFHHLQTRLGDNIEIWEYRFDLINNNFILKDSSLITKQFIVNE